MTSFVDPDHVPDFRRDQWGRPSIMQPNGKRKGYTRCSSAAKTIEDTYNLEKWARRNVAYGLAYDASLVARIIAIGGEPASWGKDEKDQVNVILEAADAVAKAHKRADMGTAVHHMTHRVDRGEEVNAGPYQADLDAYTAALKTAHLTVEEEYIECRMVNDALEMAGTADRILYNMTDFVIADIKTGATVDFGGLGWSAQLAAYAGGLLYDVDKEERLRTPPIDKVKGLIIHLPAGEGRCTIYEVDIAQGLKAAVLANEIRATRKASKSWIKPVAKIAAPPPPEQPSTGEGFTLSPTPVDDRKNAREGQPAVEAASRVQVADSVTDEATTSSVAGTTGRTQSSPQSTPPSVTAVPTDPRRTALLARYQAMNDEQKIRFTQCLDLSAADCGRDDMDNIEAILNHVDPFQTVDTEYVPPPPTESPALPAIPDEGAVVADNDVQALKKRFDALSDSAKLWTGTMIAQGRLSHHWRITDTPTTRRYELYRGVIALAEWDDNGVDEAVRAIVAAVRCAPNPELPPGELLGQLDFAQAIDFARTAIDLTTDRYSLITDEATGTLRLAAAV